MRVIPGAPPASSFAGIERGAGPYGTPTPCTGTGRASLLIAQGRLKPARRQLQGHMMILIRTFRNAISSPRRSNPGSSLEEKGQGWGVEPEAHKKTGEGDTVTNKCPVGGRREWD